MTRLLPSLLGVVLIGSVLGACGAAEAPASPPVATTLVELPKSYRFDPVDIEVAVGDTVTWTNHDDFTHNVMFDGEAALTMAPGAQVTRTFDAIGTFPYLCSLHPRDMRGTVRVGSG